MVQAALGNAGLVEDDAGVWNKANVNGDVHVLSEPDVNDDVGELDAHSSSLQVRHFRTDILQSCLLRAHISQYKEE